MQRDKKYKLRDGWARGHNRRPALHPSVQRARLLANDWEELSDLPSKETMGRKAEDQRWYNWRTQYRGAPYRLINKLVGTFEGCPTADVRRGLLNRTNGEHLWHVVTEQLDNALRHGQSMIQAGRVVYQTRYPEHYEDENGMLREVPKFQRKPKKETSFLGGANWTVRPHKDVWCMLHLRSIEKDSWAETKQEWRGSTEGYVVVTRWHNPICQWYRLKPYEVSRPWGEASYNDLAYALPKGMYCKSFRPLNSKELKQFGINQYSPPEVPATRQQN